VADRVRAKLPKLAALMDEAEEDVLTYMTFPREHRATPHSTNPIERLIPDSESSDFSNPVSPATAGARR